MFLKKTAKAVGSSLGAYQYGKFPKISNTKVSDKMIYVNSANSDQTAPEGSSLIRVCTVCHSTKNFKNQLHKTELRFTAQSTH